MLPHSVTGKGTTKDTVILRLISEIMGAIPKVTSKLISK
jgi:hypothetical protein